MTAFQFLKSLHELCHFQTREGTKVGKASNKELKRWIQNKVLRINGELVSYNEEMDFSMFSVTLFTDKVKVTLL